MLPKSRGRDAEAVPEISLQEISMWSWGCTDEEDIEELNEMSGLCWQRYESDHGVFKKLRWYGIMKEFNCKATSTWSKCCREREAVITYRQLGVKRQNWKARLDYIHAVMQEDEIAN